ELPSQTRIWVMEGWPDAPAPGEAGLIEWREEIAELVEEARLRAATLGPSARILPSAAALDRAALAAQAGTLPGLSGAEAFYTAAGPLNDRGLYLVTVTLLSALAEREARNVPAQLTRFWMSRHSVVTPALARGLQG